MGAVADGDAHVAVAAIWRQRIAGDVEADLPQHFGAHEIRAARQILRDILPISRVLRGSCTARGPIQPRPCRMAGTHPLEGDDEYALHSQGRLKVAFMLFLLHENIFQDAPKTVFSEFLGLRDPLFVTGDGVVFAP